MPPQGVALGCFLRQIECRRGGSHEFRYTDPRYTRQIEASSGRGSNRACRTSLDGVGAAAGTASRRAGEPAEPAKDYDQRALEIYEFRKAAQSGPDRGQEIYYYKCWMCHNELAQGGAPKLIGLFKRPTLVTGEPVNDETVKNQIRNGSANMGAYKYALNEADLNDLVSWLHDEKCCWNSDAPPPNPRYKGAAAPAQALYGALTGGPKGLVKNARGEPIEGIMVQLISDQTAIRTTVFSHATDATNSPRWRPAAIRCASPSRRSSIPGPKPRWRSRAPTRSRTSRSCG